ncbi:unnamed protein product [Schistocephalus solidus]|uniref:Transposase n=1 Tax=Schistocephalus solidus TaxID=70667 RepID=A0A183TB65_SCHSO|nr:unnamed protein product [Schistocephalus solidus]
MHRANTGATSVHGRRYSGCAPITNAEPVGELALLGEAWASSPGRASWSLKPRAPSPIAGLLDAVMTPDSAGGGVECAVDAAKVCYQFKLDHAQFIVPAPPFRGAYDNPRSNRPQRRTALVARELTRYKVDITALNQTRFADKGHLEEVGAGYTFF